MTKHLGKLTVTTPSDREIAMTREFNAPRQLVWEAYTKCELLKRWLGAVGGWWLDVCEVDLRPGGAYRWVWRGPNGESMGMRGEYREVEPPHRIVATEQYDEAWYQGDAWSTVELTERDGKTTLTLTVHYSSKEVRDSVLEGPAAGGVAAGFDKLEEVLQ
jgi:uncharacterized protein YndB with AHSA1/START domain